jgi:hypothetical protein
MIASCWLGRSELARLENRPNAIPRALPERTPLSRLPAVCGVPLVASVDRTQSGKIASSAKGSRLPSFQEQDNAGCCWHHLSQTPWDFVAPVSEFGNVSGSAVTALGPVENDPERMSQRICNCRSSWGLPPML